MTQPLSPSADSFYSINFPTSQVLMSTYQFYVFQGQLPHAENIEIYSTLYVDTSKWDACAQYRIWTDNLHHPITDSNKTARMHRLPEPLTCFIRLYIHSDLPEAAVIKMAMTATHCGVCTSTHRDAIFNWTASRRRQAQLSYRLSSKLQQLLAKYSVRLQRCEVTLLAS